MALTVDAISELDPDLVAQVRAEFMQLLQEAYPEVELTRGPIYDLIGQLAGGVSGAINRTEINRIAASNSLLTIAADPELADPTLVDAVLSNWGIARNPGTFATGSIAIVVSDSTPTIVAAGTRYTANNVGFVVAQAYTAKAPGSTLLGANDILMTPRGDGSFTFVVPATTDTVGIAGNLTAGTKLVPDILFDRFVTAFAATAFTGGSNTELNDALIARQEQGVAAKVMQGRQNITALILAQSEFAAIPQFSIIGYGNPEMRRDQHWIFPVSGGGRIDIYARTMLLPVTTQLTKTCTLMSRDTAGVAIWQFALSRDDAPGFYDIPQVLRTTDPLDAAGFEIVLDQRGFDLSTDLVPPDIETFTEAAYTRYQTAIIQFKDPTTDPTVVVGTTASYVAVPRSMPLLADLQAFCGGSLVRNLMSDVLVKAPVPCDLVVNLNIDSASGEPAPNIPAMQAAIANAVNGLSFPGQLYSSIVSDAVSGLLTPRQAVGKIQLHGKIRRPDGTFTYVRDNQILKIPSTPSAGVTGRVTAFLLDPNDVGVSVYTRGFEADS